MTLCSIRKQCVQALSALPKSLVEETVNQAVNDWSVRYTWIPRAGLGMLKMKDSAFNEEFFLGEIPVSSVRVMLSNSEGIQLEGGSYIMDDDLELAKLISIADALLSDSIVDNHKIIELVNQGLLEVENRSRIRSKMLMSTKVDFSLLNMVGKNDDS